MKNSIPLLSLILFGLTGNAQNIACFTVNNVSVCADTPIAFINCGSGSNYCWDFGDGSTGSTLANPTYSFDASGPGTYEIVLWVCDDAGCLTNCDSTAMTIKIRGASLIDTSYIDTGICAPYPVVFSAVGYNTDIFTWYFGDGYDTTFVMGADPANPDTNTVTFVYYYTQAGTFQPVLELQDPADSTGQRCPVQFMLPLINVSWPDLSFYKVDSLNGPRWVQFISSSTGTQNIDIYWWDFGDGYTISGLGTIPPGTNNGLTAGTYDQPTHYYADTGVYDVTVGAWITSGPDSCSSMVTNGQYISIFDDSTGAGSNTFELVDQVYIYPNPTTGILPIERVEGIATVYDIYGRLVLNANTNTLDISNAAMGIYFVRVVDEQGKMYVGKVLKE